MPYLQRIKRHHEKSFVKGAPVNLHGTSGTSALQQKVSEEIVNHLRTLLHLQSNAMQSWKFTSVSQELRPWPVQSLL